MNRNPIFSPTDDEDETILENSIDAGEYAIEYAPRRDRVKLGDGYTLSIYSEGDAARWGLEYGGGTVIGGGKFIYDEEEGCWLEEAAGIARKHRGKGLLARVLSELNRNLGCIGSDTIRGAGNEASWKRANAAFDVDKDRWFINPLRRRNPANPRHVFGGTRDLIPHPREEEPAHIRGLRAGKSLRWCCRCLGFDIYLVDGKKVSAQWADFVGGGHHLAYRFIPRRDIWIDDRIKEWPGYLASHELIEAILMHVRKWSYERAHAAANELEQQLRAAGELGMLKGSLRDIWYAHLAMTLNGLDHEHLDEMARQAQRQLWKYL